MIVHVTAPSRLHFGLLSFGNERAGQFGGVGAMVEQPGLRLTIYPADTLEVVGPLASRARGFVGRYAEAPKQGAELKCRIEITAAPPEHVGLGTGTQLGLAVVAGLARFHGRRLESAAELAEASGRGFRSTIGTHGFCRGGVIYEEVKHGGQLVAPLHDRLAMPDGWCWLLTRPVDQIGLSGEVERAAFAALPPVPPSTTEQLRREVREQMLPALRQNDFEAFGESVYRYGVLAGNCFASRQGGPYASPRLARLVEMLREFGVRGVGQSSWGPTIFALVPSHDEAQRLRRHLVESPEIGALEGTISVPNNCGASIRAED
jgi:beta-RFAP synthase